jgi:hypothetical protein
LEDLDMQESAIMRQWRKDGALENARGAVLNVLQARFPDTPVPQGVRAALEGSVDVRQLTDWLRAAVLIGSAAEFERSLVTLGYPIVPPTT